MDLAEECKLSFYEELCVLHENDKSKMILVKCNLDNKIYVKKIITNYNIDVYKLLKDSPHKNVVKIYEVIEGEDVLYIIEEFVNGRDLEEVLDGKEINTEEQVRDYIFQLCNGLQHIHSLELPIIHRDVKPSNIMLTGDNVIKLIDFDASRTFKETKEFVRDTVLLGTAGFAPPEQYGFAQTDCRSDIYAVGILINYLLIGKHPNEEMYSGKLTKVIKKCTNIKQQERYSNVEELIKDIYNKPLKVIEGTASSWIPPGFRSKNPWKIIIAMIGYISIFACSLDMGDNTKFPIIDKIAFSIAAISIVALCSNYRNIANYIPMVKSNNIVVKVLGYFVFSFLILILCVMLGMFFDGFIDIFI